MVTRERTARSLMLRVVRQPPPADPEICTDRRANGRSAYVSRSLDAVREARRRKKLSFALRTEVPTSIYDQLEAAVKLDECAATSLAAADAFGRTSPLPPVGEVAEPALVHDAIWM